MHPLPPLPVQESAEVASLRAQLEAERAVRLRAEQALRDRERKVAEVEELARLGSWEQALTGPLEQNPVHWSAEQLRIHGLDESTRPNTFAEFIERVHPDDRASVTGACERLLATGEPFGIVYRAIPAEGEVRWVHGLARIVAGGDGQPPRMIGTCQDITERHLAEHALRERDRTLDEVETLARLGTWEWSLDTDVIRWSPEQLRIHGMSTDAGTQSFAEFLARVHPDDRARVREECDRLIATGEAFSFPYRVVRPDGTLREMHAMGKLLPDATGRQVRMVGTAQDVTERNRADRALRASEARFRDLFEQFPHSVQILSPEGDTLQVNPAFDRLWALPMEELAHYNPLRDPRLAPLHELLERGIAGERVTLPEVEHERPGLLGGEAGARLIRSFLFAVRDEEGAVREVVLVHEDVTEQRRAEEAVRNSEASYRAIFELSNDPIYVHDVETGAILDANRKACEAAGMASVDEIRERGMALIAGGEAPFTPERAMEYVRRAAAGEPQRFEWRTGLGARGQQWSEVSLNRVNIGGVDRLLATARDITERKRAEQALRDSERSYRTIFDWTAAGIWVHDIETGAFLDVNQTACHMYGYSVDEFRALGVEGISWGEPPYTIGDARVFIERAVAGEPQRFEWLGRHKDGSPTWAHMTLRRVTINGEDRLLATGRDTTEWKAAQQALRASEAGYRTIFDHTAAAIWVHDLETGEMLEVNRAACELYGYTADEQKRIGLEGLIWGEAPYTMDETRRIFDLARAGEPQRFVWLGRHKDGGEVWTEVQALRVDWMDAPRLLVTARGMNEWRAAADALRRANEELEARVTDRTAELAAANEALEEEVAEHEAARDELMERTRELEGVFHALPDRYFRLDPHGRIHDYRAGRAGAAHTPRPDVLGRLFHEILPGEAGARFRVALDEATRTRDLQCVEYALERGGGMHDFEARVVPLEDGTFVTVVRDITERKQAEAELIRQKAYFEGIIGSLESGVAVFDRALRFEYASPSSVRDPAMRAWVVGRTVLEYGEHAGLPERVYRARHESLERAVAERATVQFEEEVRVADGTSRHMLRRALPLLDARGEVVRLIGYSVDITERKRAEEALQEREEHFRRLIENASDMVQVVGADARIVYTGPSVERLLGYTPEEIQGTSITDYVHPDDLPQTMESFAAMLANPGVPVPAAYRVRHRDGRWRDFEAQAMTLASDSAEEGVVVNARDITERRVADRALQRSEEHFRSLIENGTDLLMIVDAASSITYVGPSSLRLLGYAPEEMLGQVTASLVHPDDLAQTAETLARLVADPTLVVAAEWRIRHRDGSWRHFESFAKSLALDPAGARVVVNARDITERKAAERALQRSEEHFRALIENAHDLTVIIDASGRFVYQSPSMERIYGRPGGDTLGHTAWELMHPDDVPAVAAEFARVLAEPGTIGHVEYRYRHADGSWVYTEAFGRTLVPDSAEQGVVVNARDVTERRLAELALRDQEERLRFALDAGRMGAWEWDVESGRVMWSPTLEELHGIAPGTFGGTVEAALSDVHPEDRPGLEAAIAAAFESAGTYEIQYRCTWPDGSVHWLETKGRVVEDGTGRAVRMVGVCTDVTERKRAEAALRRATADAERANRAKSEFLSRMSHELRTPMNSILGFAQVLARAGLSADHNKFLQHILKGGRHLLNLINEVLEISRIESGRQSLSLEPVHVGTVLQEALGLVRPLAEQRRVELDDAPWLMHPDAYAYADRQRLTQVVLNLLSNAVKYNRPGGRVRLWCASEAGDEGASWVRVRIEDTGPGIPADKADQLFTPFARLGAEQTEVEGTGLGLALSLRLAEAMGGDLRLESSGTGGSVFLLELRPAENPLIRAEDPAGAPPAAAEGPHGAARVLYIEDNLANLALVETFLMTRPEWKTIPALQGLVGIELAREHRPDLVLLDLHLPDMHGSEVLRRLRSDDRTAAVPVVVISADATATAVEELLAAGADAYLTKPLDLDEFLRTLERFLPDPPEGA